VLALQYALLSFIPLLGSPVGILIAAIITLIVRPAATLPVTLILIVVDQVVAYGVLPRILKTTVGVPGLVGLVAVSIGVQLFSFWGLIFSIPIVGAIYALIFDFYLPRQRRGASASEAVASGAEEASRRMGEEALSSPAAPGRTAR
jgi:predicted PurR-regulated permease PerM